MRHKHAFRKLSRSTSHRDLLLRNLVTSLLMHESIITTVPKAKEAARVAEKVISWGKKGQRHHQTKAAQFLLNFDGTQSKLFKELAKRYEFRPGGYTRIQKFGFRQGDHAPRAILQLVDGPKDTRLPLAAKEVGYQLASQLEQHPRLVKRWRLASAAFLDPEASGHPSEKKPKEAPLSAIEQLPNYAAVKPLLHPLSQLNVLKALSFKPHAVQEFQVLAQDAFDETRAKLSLGPHRPDVAKHIQLVKAKRTRPNRLYALPTIGYKRRAGETAQAMAEYGRTGYVQRKPSVQAGTAVSWAKGVQASTRWQPGYRNPAVVKAHRKLGQVRQLERNVLSGRQSAEAVV